MSELAIDIGTLRKCYGRFVALAGVSLAVPKGEVFGLLGPNGAGKSTLVKSLLTIVRPTRCDGSLLGQRIGHRKTLARVGYLPEHARFPDYLTGRQIISYSAGLAKVPRRVAKARAEHLLEIVGMAEWADRKNGTYSKGMRQRVGLAQALVNEPEIVFLDEPTDGVDPEGRVEIRKLIERMREEGRTVFVNSHLLGEVEQVADRVAIMARGAIVKQGTVEELTHAENRYEIKTLGPVPVEARKTLEEEGISVAGDTIHVHAEGAEQVQPVIDLLRGTGSPIRQINEVRSTLEDVFMEAVNRQKGEAV
ncbi:ATP-binding cassette domain-containing protein [Haloferula rosea]|uniref:ABC transporter ATP-binding protein n=1 Tax=Haloferula rosea TaxID=490093 RepID=A0A934RAX9_9BACT|nr:ABC transporter ATP-binding protein [Haloferula rosea]MBK1825999.1 ABC transporter ATP-binding protein [Haloferula rosea]